MTNYSTYIKSISVDTRQTTWPLTFFDRGLFPAVISAKWIYKHRLDDVALQNSLSHLLSYYPHLAGRVHKGTHVKLTNQGILFQVCTEQNIGIQDVSDTLAATKLFTPPLSRTKLLFANGPLMAVRLTMLSDGCVLCVSCSHCVVDGFSYYTMMKDWSDLSKGLDIEPPVLDQSILEQKPTHTKAQTKQQALQLGWHSTINLNAVLKLLDMLLKNRRTKRAKPIYFTQETLDQIQGQLLQKHGLRTTKNSIVTALTIKWISSQLKHSNNQDCSITLIVDCRKRITYIPPKFIGNAVTMITIHIHKANAKIEEIIVDIDKGIQPLRDNHSQQFMDHYKLDSHLRQYKLLLASIDSKNAFSSTPSSYCINNFTQFPVYDVDFEGRGPEFVIPHFLGDLIMIWPAPPERGGIEVYLSSPLEEFVTATTISEILSLR